MPALAKALATLPRFVPHRNGASAGAGSFPQSSSTPQSSVQPASVFRNSPGGIDRLAHDARNVLAGLMLYSELLSAPGVLTREHQHYAGELDRLARTATQLMERILDRSSAQKLSEPNSPVASPDPVRAVFVTDTAAELRYLQPLLTAVVGPSVRLSVATTPCAGRIALTIEELTRILVNLVRNAADAMPSGGNVRITAQYADGLSFPDTDCPPHSALLTVADDGPGIPESLMERIFDPGFTTRGDSARCSGSAPAGWPSLSRRGLGLSIVRDLVEAAGGIVRAVSNNPRGARFEISLPLCVSVTSGTYAMPPGSAFSADSRGKGCIECQ